ncbi:MAG TPA: YwiC-like family protein [Symbiobacteriaceae bacterium]|nr:YwiC-like family protein [Symbiobacteriaceae bacterium]
MSKLIEPGRPPLPREHGAWAMLLTPPAVALLGAGLHILGLLAAFGWIAAYCLRGPVEALRGMAPTGRAGLAQAAPEVARFWLLAFGLLAMLLLAPVVYMRPVTALLLMAALVLLGAVFVLAERGQTRSFAAGALAIAGLMLGGPLYYIAAYGAAGARGWALALASAAFFIGSIFRVKTLARERRSAWFRCLSLGFHAAVVLLAAGAAWLGHTSWLTAASLLPPLIWAAYGAARAGEAVNLAVVGKGEQWLTIAFGLLLAGALRTSPL